MIKLADKLKEWFLKNAEKKSADVWLKVIAFTESSFFPIPPDPFLVAVTVVKKNKWRKLAFDTALYSVLGGVFGYFIGLWLFEVVAQPLVDFYGFQEEIEKISFIFNDATFWSVFIAAFSPIPYKVFTISAGLFQVNFFIFLIASIAGRFLRFFIVGYIAKYLGEKFSDKIFKHFNLLTLVAAFIIILYLVFKYI